MQHLHRLAFCVGVSKVEMTKLDLALQPSLRPEHPVRRRVIDRRLLRHQFVDADHRGRAALHQVHHPAQRNHRPGEHHHVGVEGHELAH